MIVVDVGCADHGADRSIVPLIEQYQPRILYGFDPQATPGEWDYAGTRVVVRDEAAWIYDGVLQFEGDNLGARVVDEGGRTVRCIDIVQFIRDLAPVEVVLKLDCEGSEYQIVEQLASSGVDSMIKVLLVEWHCPWCRHGGWSHAPGCDASVDLDGYVSAIEARLDCVTSRWML